MKQSTVLEGYLRSTEAALATEAPELIEHIRAILQRPPAKKGAQHRGDSVDYRYPVDLPPETSVAIRDALKRVEEREGYDKRFHGYQVNLLVWVWGRVVNSQ